MTDYWILLATLGMAVLVLVSALLLWWEHMEHAYTKHNLDDARAENIALKVENEALHKAADRATVPMRPVSKRGAEKKKEGEP